MKQMRKTSVKTVLAVLAAVLIFGGCGIKIPQEITDLTLPYVDENIVTTFDIVLPQHKYLALETENQRLMYKAMLLAIKEQAAKTLEIPGDLTDDEVKEVYGAVADDYPQFFEPSITYRIIRVQNGSDKVKSVSCELSYIENDPEAAAARRQALYDKVNAILAQAVTITDPLQRERFFYETVIHSGKYDSNQPDLINIDLDTHTAYGCLVEGATVCDGYAKAFALLCNYGGIEAWTESGYLEGISHAWNGVKIDGKIYYCDPTVDDAESRYYGEDHVVIPNPKNTETLTALPPAATMLYFNLTRAEMSADHIFQSTATADDATNSAAVTQGALTRFSSRSELASWMAGTLSTAQSGSGFAVAADFSISMSGFGELISGAGITNTCLYTQNGAGTRFYIYVI